jgi:hypothetical protein
MKNIFKVINNFSKKPTYILVLKYLFKLLLIIFIPILWYNELARNIGYLSDDGKYFIPSLPLLYNFSDIIIILEIAENNLVRSKL